jgi:hypothetical protein
MRPRAEKRRWPGLQRGNDVDDETYQEGYENQECHSAHDESEDHHGALAPAMEKVSQERLFD